MNFHDIRFPASLSFGALGGPERRTEIVALANGFEERNSPWAQSRRRYDAGLGMRSLDDLAEAVAFFEARQGQLYGFRWKDWTDYKSCAPSEQPGPQDQLIATGDEVQTVFELVKRYTSGGHSHKRRITKPILPSVSIALDGDELIEGEGFSVDYTTGLVHFTDAPPLGAPITAGFEFDVPVRFDTDRIAVSYAGFEAGEIPAIPVVEVRV
ncbi:MAG: DUF2460 domain-containing protein [Paracoccaceae bacterium]